MQQRMLCAYSFVLQRCQVGDWVYYLNPRKYVEGQKKWSRKFTGPFLVVGVPGPVNVNIHRIFLHFWGDDKTLG